MNEGLPDGPAIEASGLVKRYGDEVVAVTGGDPLSLWLCWGAVLAFAALGMWLAYAAFRNSIK